MTNVRGDGRTAAVAQHGSHPLPQAHDVQRPGLRVGRDAALGVVEGGEQETGLVAGRRGVEGGVGHEFSSVKWRREVVAGGAVQRTGVPGVSAGWSAGRGRSRGLARLGCRTASGWGRPGGRGLDHNVGGSGAAFRHCHTAPCWAKPHKQCGGHDGAGHAAAGSGRWAWWRSDSRDGQQAAQPVPAGGGAAAPLILGPEGLGATVAGVGELEVTDPSGAAGLAAGGLGGGEVRLGDLVEDQPGWPAGSRSGGERHRGLPPRTR